MNAPAGGKPRLLVIARNLPPLVGGMERLLARTVLALRETYEVHVVGPAGCRQDLPEDVPATEVSLRPLPWFLIRALVETLRSARRLRPSLVFAGSGLTAPLAVIAARLVSAPCVAYLHGLDVSGGTLPYALLWQPFLRRCDLVLVNSRFTRDLALRAGIAAERIHVLHPGVELPDLGQAAKLRRDFRERHRLGEKPVLLYAGRITPRKGLAAFAREVLPRIVACFPNARLIVAGAGAQNALFGGASEERQARSELSASGLARNALLLGVVSDQELGAAYFAADVMVLPLQRRGGDHEGFGMVAVEAAAHGLPTVAFEVGGVADAIADGTSGRRVREGDNGAFAQAAMDYLSAPDANRKRTATDAASFAQAFSWDKFSARLTELLAQVPRNRR